MLWNTTLPLPKKLGLIGLFSGGVFIIVCALVRAVLIVTVSRRQIIISKERYIQVIESLTFFQLKDPIGGAQVAGSWAIRETFVAVVTTNVPMAFPLVSGWVKPLLSSLARSMRSESFKRSTDGKFKRAVTTFSAVGGNGPKRQSRNPRTSPNHLPGLTFTESEERMLSQGQIKLQDLAAANSSRNPAPSSQSDDNSDGIRKDVEIAVTSVATNEEGQTPQSFAYASGPMRKKSNVRLPK